MSLKKIAEELGLSLTTVSRALNGYPEVADHTRRAVTAAAARLQYKPDARARGLALGRADAVGVVFPFAPGDFADSAFLKVAGAMSSRFAESGLDLFIIAASGADELLAYRRAIMGRRVDAFVVARTQVQDERLRLLRAAGMPFIAYGRSDAFDEDYAWFDFDNEAGARMAAERLLGFGHRRIAYLGAPEAYNFAVQRYRGFCTALSDAGAAFDPALARRGALDRRSGFEAVQSLLALAEPPTALLVDNHLAGVGAVHALLQADRALGRDISVIVYDGLGADSVIRHSITSIEQPTAEKVGHRLAEMLLALLRGEEVKRLHTLWQPELVAGQSDGAVG